MPTTLSIEERRVKESIERLDRQLQGKIRSIQSILAYSIYFNGFLDVQTRTRSTSGTRTQKYIFVQFISHIIMFFFLLILETKNDKFRRIKSSLFFFLYIYKYCFFLYFVFKLFI